MCDICRSSAEVELKNEKKSDDFFELAHVVLHREWKVTPCTINEIDKSLRTNRVIKATYVLVLPHRGMS